VRYQRVVGGILVDSNRVAYVLGFKGSRPSYSAALAGSILQNGDGGGEKKLATSCP
jgi:hypothetical protein